MKYIKLIQLKGVDGQNVGLYGIKYGVPLKVMHNVQKHFDEAFAVAKCREEHYLENDYEEEIFVQDEADDALALLGIERIFADICTTDVI